MRMPNMCVGCLASCIVTIAAVDIGAHVDFALSSAPVHLRKTIKHEVLECRQALKRIQVGRYLRAASTLGAPLQVAIAWKLLGSNQQQLKLTDAEQEKKDQTILTHHSQSLQHQAPWNVFLPKGWMPVVAGTVSCLTMIVFALALARAFMKRRLVLQNQRCKQRHIEVTIPRRRRRRRTLTCDHQDRCRHLVSSFSTTSSPCDLTLPEPERSVTDTTVASGNQSDGAKSEQLRMAALARHIKISGIDKRPAMPIGLSNAAVGVVKDRCETINTSLERQQSVEVPEFTTQFLREESMGDKVQDISKQFEGERIERRNQRRKTAPAGTMQIHDIDQVGLVTTRGQKETSSTDKLPQFGGCQLLECSDSKLPNFGRNSQNTMSSEREGQSESMSRLLAG